MIERALPHNIDAEQGVLASIMIDPRTLDEVSDILQPEDFYRDGHRIIYKAMLELARRHSSLDSLSLCDELQCKGLIEQAGGIMYISTMYNYELHAGNIAHHAQIVARDAELRRLIWAAGQIAQVGWDRDPKATEKAEQIILSIKRSTHVSAFTAMPEVMADYMNEELQHLHDHKGAIVGVPTGYADLDETLGGLQKSDLILLAARPSIGKTSLGLCIGYNAALQGKKVAVFSLEMGKRQLARRLMAMDSKVDMQRLRKGWIDDDEWEKVIHSVGSLSELPLWINDTSGNPIASMRAQLRRLVKEQRGVDLVIVDYLGLIDPGDDASHYKNTVQQISEISKGLKHLAREFDLPVLALAQLSRAVEQRAVKIPMLSDLRDSGSLEQDADVVLFIYRDDYYAVQEHRESKSPNIADIYIAKHRNGPTGQVALYFEASQTMFYPLEQEA